VISIWYAQSMKICLECGVSKPLDEFRNRQASADGKESRCRECRRAADNATYKSNPARRNSIRAQMNERSLQLKKFVREYLESHPCVDCGLDDADLLEFDHVRGTKVAGISRLIKGACKMQRLLDEIDKCEVRCLHCHRKRTIKQLGWYTWVSSQ
jgi:hypothetical protein